MSEVIALVDIGGSSVKVSIYSPSMDEVMSCTEPALPASKDEDVTQDPSVLLEKILSAMNCAGRRLSLGISIGALYVSSIRQGFCLISGHEELTPLIYNRDTSGKHSEEELKTYGWDRLYEETGHWFAPQLTLPKLLHLRRSNPKLFNAETRLAFVHDWLVWNLTGVLLTEMTLVSAGQMALLTHNRVNEEMLEQFGFDRNLVPQIGKFGDTVGRIRPKLLTSLGPEWQRCIVRLGGGDSHFLHMGASHNQEGTIVISAGSSTPISYLKSNLTNSALARPWKSTSFVHDLYLHEGNCGYPGTYFGWLVASTSGRVDSNHFELPIQDIEIAANVFGSCYRWTYESWRDCPPFSILNQTPQHGVEQLLLGLTLDYAFSLKSQILDLTGGGVKPTTQIMMTGGGANTFLARILQTILGGSVQVVDSEECAKNLLYQISTAEIRQSSAQIQVQNFSDEVRNSLLKLEKTHWESYLTIEGAGEVIRSVA